MYNLSPDTVATPIDVWPETLPQKECIGEISPSSTLDVLPGPPRQEPAKPPSPPPADKSSSRHHMLQVRLEDGAVLARGESGMCEEGEFFIGHLGVGEEWGEPVTSWKTVALPSAAQPCKEVAAGDLHSLFLCQGGMVLSCGGGWEGVLGHGDEGTTAIPRPIAALAHVTIQRVAAGGAHSLAVAEGGKLYSWGWGRHGQLGLGDQGTQLSPRHVESIEGVVQVAAGKAHSLALCSDGAVYSFGRATAGQCGQGVCGAATPAVLVPTRVTALDGRAVREVQASADGSSALVASAALYRWGVAPGQPTAVPVPTLREQGSM